MTVHEAHDRNGAQSSRKPTKLPKFQLFVTYMSQFAEPVTATVVYPFAPQFVRSTGITGGDETKTGYYAGAVESAFFLTESLTVYFWARASDHFGRRPVLILGPLGLAIAMIGFGLSKHFWSLVLFRAIQGVFNGNIGVGKTVLAELADATNMAYAFSGIPVVWNMGMVFGPLIGGVFAVPAETFPDTLGRISLLREYPYLLPCLIAGSLSFISFLFVLLGLKETLHAHVAKDEAEPLLAEESRAGYGTTEAHESRIDQTYEEHRPPTMKELFTPRVRITLLNYGLLAFCDMSYAAIIPLMYSTSIENGGLGLPARTIGTILGSIGIFGGLMQVLVFASAIQRYGPRTMFTLSLYSLVFAFLTLPCMNYVAKSGGQVDIYVYLLIALQICAALMVSPAYSCMQVLIVDSATKSSLASANSVAQMTACGMRAFAPTVASSLFAVSAEKNILGGSFVYLVLILMVGLGIWTSYKLPRGLQKLG